MATYNNLELEHYYLVKETEEAGIILLQPVMETGKCVLLLQIDEMETTFWKKKDDVVFDIIEELTEEQVAEYEALFADDDDEDDWQFDETQFGFDDEVEAEDDALNEGEEKEK